MFIQKTGSGEKRQVHHSIRQRFKDGQPRHRITDNRAEAAAQRKLFGLVNQSPQVRQLRASALVTAGHSRARQRLPWITSDQRRYYRLGSQFSDDHVLDGDGDACEAAARQAADTNRTRYTIIRKNSIDNLTRGTETDTDGNYDWAMTVNVRCAVGGWDGRARRYGVLQGYGSRNITVMGYDSQNRQGRAFRLITHITD